MFTPKWPILGWPALVPYTFKEEYFFYILFFFFNFLYFGDDQDLSGIFYHDFVVVAKKSLPGPGSQMFSPVFSFRCCIILGFVFGLMILFLLILWIASSSIIS